MKDFLGILLMGMLLSSCEGDIQLDFQWTAMEISNADNSTLYPEATSADSLLASVYAIQLNMTSEEIAQSGRYLDTETPPRNLNRLDSLIITSTGDFDEAHLAGSNLTGLFYFLLGDYFNTVPADGSEGYNLSNVRSSNFFDDPMVENMDLILDAQPTLDRDHQFTVEWILSDSTIFLDVTAPIKLVE